MDSDHFAPDSHHLFTADICTNLSSLGTFFYYCSMTFYSSMKMLSAKGISMLHKCVQTLSSVCIYIYLLCM